MTPLGKRFIALGVLTPGIEIIISHKYLRKYNGYKNHFWIAFYDLLINLPASSQLLDKEHGLDLPHHNYFHFQVGLLGSELKYSLSY